MNEHHELELRFSHKEANQKDCLTEKKKKKKLKEVYTDTLVKFK